jgi:hypothetical protein
MMEGRIPYKLLQYCIVGGGIPGRPAKKWKDLFDLDELEAGTSQ